MIFLYKEKIIVTIYKYSIYTLYIVTILFLLSRYIRLLYRYLSNYTCSSFVILASSLRDLVSNSRFFNFLSKKLVSLIDYGIQNKRANNMIFPNFVSNKNSIPNTLGTFDLGCFNNITAKSKNTLLIFSLFFEIS